MPQRATRTVNLHIPCPILRIQSLSSLHFDFDRKSVSDRPSTSQKSSFIQNQKSVLLNHQLTKMKIITFLAFSTGLAAPYAAAAPSPALIPDVSYPDGVVVTYYSNGLPAGLYPGAELTSRAMSLEKRDPVIVVDAPGVNDQTSPRVGVYACSDKNFSGRCVYIRSRPGQCGMRPLYFTWGKGCLVHTMCWLINMMILICRWKYLVAGILSPNANDQTSSVGPDRPWKCRFYV